MANDLKSIQELINAKADARLAEEIAKVHKVIFNNEGYKLLKDVAIEVGTPDKPRQTRLSNILTTEGFYDKVFAANRDRYRSDETNAFLAEVGAIKKDVDGLLNLKLGSNE